MQQLNPSEFESPRSANPLRTAVLVIYLTLALLAVTIPQSLTNWLLDMNGNPVEETALRGAAVMQNLSQRAGIAAVYRRTRDAFLAVSGAEPD
jgi:hypothetical protein